ncbi:MAG: isoprenylcysteine carboxylmethyltransferase family protein [Planctomycetota bacterium]
MSGFSGSFDDLRVVCGVAAWLTFPPGCLFWLGVHPFAEFWRRAGLVCYATYVTSVYVLWFAASWPWRDFWLGPPVGLGFAGAVGGGVLLAGGVGVAVMRTRTLPTAWLFGAGQVRGGRLLTDGLYAHVRHPRYVEAMLQLAGLVLLSDRLGVASLLLICPAILAAVIPFEEKELARRFGAEYEAYASRTPRFWPRKAAADPGEADGPHRFDHDEDR